MGNWKLEVGRMVSYVAFPVVLYYLFNQPWFHEKLLKYSTTGMMPPETPKWKYIEAAIRAAEKQKEKEMELEMERYLNAFVKNEKKSES